MNKRKEQPKDIVLPPFVPGTDGNIIDGDFVVAAEALEDGWRSFELSRERILSVTTGVEMNTGECENLRMAIIGTIYDPRQPMLEINNILETLIKERSPETLSRALLLLGGCFVVMAFWKRRAVIFTDATALRKVYYYTGKDSDVKMLLSSSRFLLARSLSLRAIDELNVNPKDYQVVGSAPYLPGDLTEYAMIKHLMPCHYLDVEKRKQIRFYPHEKPRDLSYSKIIDAAVTNLRGAATATERLHTKCMIAMTAGFDSRISLAAFSSVLSPKTFGAFTFQYPYINAEHSDISIAKQVCAKAGVSHQIIPLEDSHDAVKRFNETCGGTVVNSNIADAYRVFYRLPAWACTPKFMLKYEGNFVNSYTVDSMRRWFDRRGQLNGVDWLECFYWEHRLSRWAAIDFSGADIRVAKANIFNSLELFHLALQVPYAVRKSTQFSVDLIEALQPGLAGIPINPSDGVKECIKSYVKQSFLGAYVKYIYTLVK